MLYNYLANKLDLKIGVPLEDEIYLFLIQKINMPFKYF